MHTGDKLGATAVTAIVLQQQLARFLVQSRLRIWVDQETFDRDQDVLNPI